MVVNNFMDFTNFDYNFYTDFGNKFWVIITTLLDVSHFFFTLFFIHSFLNLWSTLVFQKF